MVDYRMSASRLCHLLVNGDRSLMTEKEVERMLKYARHVMYPSQPWIRSNASKRAMTIGKVYESSALCYLADQKIVTDMQTQHIQAPDDDQKRLIQIIKTINMYPILTEQYKAFNRLGHFYCTSF